MSPSESIDDKSFIKTSPPKIENLLNPSTTLSSSSSSSLTTTTTTISNDTERKVKKRARRKYNDVERYFTCDFINCNKSYGSLTHLNEHRVIQRHGARLKLDDFTNVKQQIEFTKLQKKIANHETIILDPPMDNEYYQSLLLLEQQQHQQQHQQQQQQFQHHQQQQQQMYYSNTIPYHESIPVLQVPLHHESSIISNPILVANPIPIIHTTPNMNNNNGLINNSNDNIIAMTTNDNNNITYNTNTLFNNENCQIDNNNNNKFKLPPITELLNSNISNCDNDQGVKNDMNR